MKIFDGLKAGLGFILLLGGFDTAYADIRLQQPIDCTLGQDCILQQFMDHDPSEGSNDFACGAATYDGHKGTDFRVLPARMKAGVRVLAAADGIVGGLRNNMADKRIVSEADFADVKGKECGNGLVLQHQDGWETQYCHMKRGTVSVQTGQHVKAGDLLGLVGLSGKTQFAHLHLSVRHNGQPVDPFAPEYDDGTCQYNPETSLWGTALPYQPSQVFNVGLSDGPVTMADLVQGRGDGFSPDPQSPLVVYGLAVNGQPGDELQLILHGPDGEIVNSIRDPLPRAKAQFLGYAGKRAPATGWPKGAYNFMVQIKRHGSVLHQKSGLFVLK